MDHHRRTFMKLLGSGLTGTAVGLPLIGGFDPEGVRNRETRATAGKRHQEASGIKWYEKPARVIGVNIWAPEWYEDSLENFDADRMAEAQVQADANVAFTFQGFTHDHFGLSFFSSEIGERHENLNGRDIIGSYVEACHERDHRIFGYYSYTDARVAREHPDWCQRRASGELIGANFGAGMPCPNSPYRKYYISRIAEIVRRYPLDGILLDNTRFMGSGCYCPYCQEKFQAEFGREIPEQSEEFTPEWQEYVEWRYESIREIHAALRKKLRAIRPEMVITHNSFALRFGHQWKKGEDFSETLPMDDVVTSIYDWYNRAPSRYVDRIWQAGLQTKYLRGISDRPVWMQFGRFPYTRDYQLKPHHELELGAYSIIINGGSPAIIDNAYPDGTIDPRAYERMGRLYGEIAEKEEFLAGAEPVPFAAVHYSRKSNDYYTQEYPDEQRYQAAFEGAGKILVEGKIPYQIIGDGKLTSVGHEPFELLVLPDTVVLSNSELQAVEQFVRGGGTVIGTTNISRRDGQFVEREGFGLDDVFGMRYEGMLDADMTFVKPEEHTICHGLDPRYRIPMRAMQTQVGLTDGTMVAHQVAPAARTERPHRVFTFEPSDVPPGEPTGYPAVVANSFGDGTAIYFAGDVTGNYSVYGYSGLRRLFVNAVNWAVGDRLPVRVNGPLNLEAQLHEQPHQDRWILHLLNYTTTALRYSAHTGGPLSEGGVPVHDTEVEVRVPSFPKRVYQYSTGSELDYNDADGKVRFTVPTVDVHEMVVMEGVGE